MRAMSRYVSRETASEYEKVFVKAMSVLNVVFTGWILGTCLWQAIVDFTSLGFGGRGKYQAYRGELALCLMIASVVLSVCLALFSKELMAALKRLLYPGFILSLFLCVYSNGNYDVAFAASILVSLLLNVKADWEKERMEVVDIFPAAAMISFPICMAYSGDFAEIIGNGFAVKWGETWIYPMAIVCCTAGIWAVNHRTMVDEQLQYVLEWLRKMKRMRKNRDLTLRDMILAVGLIAWRRVCRCWQAVRGFAEMVFSDGRALLSPGGRHRWRSELAGGMGEIMLALLYLTAVGLWRMYHNQIRLPLLDNGPLYMVIWFHVGFLIAFMARHISTGGSRICLCPLLLCCLTIRMIQMAGNEAFFGWLHADSFLAIWAVMEIISRLWTLQDRENRAAWLTVIGSAVHWAWVYHFSWYGKMDYILKVYVLLSAAAVAVAWIVSDKAGKMT